MDWKKVGSAIVKIAPWIAGSFGTPALGAAVGALCNVFNLDPASATPEILSAAIANATPDQIAALRLADQRHAETMANMGYQLDLAQITLNTAETKTGSLFIAGWRPWLGWWLVNALVYHLIAFPVLTGLLPLLHDMDAGGFAACSTLLTILIGARTYEKKNDVATQQIGAGQ